MQGTVMFATLITVIPMCTDQTSLPWPAASPGPNDLSGRDHDRARIALASELATSNSVRQNMAVSKSVCQSDLPGL